MVLPMVLVTAGIFDEALEVMFDVDFPGGTNLGGRINGRWVMAPCLPHRGSCTMYTLAVLR
jgi:hypothetical protein